MIIGAESGSFAVIPRKDSAQPLLPLNLALVCGLEIRAKNLVPDILSLMRAFIIVIRQPFAIDVIQVIQTKTNEVVKALFLNDADTRFAIPVCLGSTWRSLYNFCARCFPQSVESKGKLRIPVANKMSRFDPNVLQPHLCVSRLLKYPSLVGIKGRGTHENSATSQMNKHEHIGIETTFECINRLREKITGHQRIHVGADELFPCACRIL